MQPGALDLDLPMYGDLISHFERMELARSDLKWSLSPVTGVPGPGPLVCSTYTLP